MNQPENQQLRRWAWWSWGLIVSTPIMAVLFMSLSSGIIRSVYQPGDVPWLVYEILGGLAYCIAIALQFASVRIGMRLARHWHPALWWVVPQMILVFGFIAELVVCLMLLLLGLIPTALQLLAWVGLTSPVVLIGVIGYTISWARSVCGNPRAVRIGS